jgi:hypothetical protein
MEEHAMSTLIPLENVRVASPCRADWNLMEGDDRTRFCQSCAKHVYNLSSMSKAEAEGLIAEKEGRLCVRFYQRADGTVLTDNCPIGLKVARRPFKYLMLGFAALLASGTTLLAQSGEVETQPTPSRNFNVRRFALANYIIEKFDSDGATMGKPAPPIMGDIACPAPTPTPTPTPKPKS